MGATQSPLIRAHMVGTVFITMSLLVSLIATFATDVPPIRLEVTPQVSTSPLHFIHFRLRILANDANRSFTVAMNGEDFYRSTSEQLDGANAAVTHQINWNTTFIPCGTYEVTAQTFTQAGAVIATARSNVQVCGD